MKRSSCKVVVVLCVQTEGLLHKRKAGPHTRLIGAFGNGILHPPEEPNANTGSDNAASQGQQPSGSGPSTTNTTPKSIFFRGPPSCPIGLTVSDMKKLQPVGRNDEQYNQIGIDKGVGLHRRQQKTTTTTIFWDWDLVLTNQAAEEGGERLQGCNELKIRVYYADATDETSSEAFDWQEFDEGKTPTKFPFQWMRKKGSDGKRTKSHQKLDAALFSIKELYMRVGYGSGIEWNEDYWYPQGSLRRVPQEIKELADTRECPVEAIFFAFYKTQRNKHDSNTVTLDAYKFEDELQYLKNYVKATKREDPKKIKELETQLAQQETQIKQLQEAQLAQKHDDAKKIEELKAQGIQKENQLKETHAGLREKEKELQEKEKELQKREANLEEREAELAETKANLEERETKLGGREAELREREAELREREAELREKEKKLQKREAELAKLEEREKELDEREKELDEREKELVEGEQQALRKQQLDRVEEEERETKLQDIAQQFEDNLQKLENLKQQVLTEQEMLEQVQEENRKCKRSNDDAPPSKRKWFKQKVAKMFPGANLLHPATDSSAAEKRRGEQDQFANLSNLEILRRRPDTDVVAEELKKMKTAEDLKNDQVEQGEPISGSDFKLDEHGKAPKRLRGFSPTNPQ